VNIRPGTRAGSRPRRRRQSATAAHPYPHRVLARAERPSTPATAEPGPVLAPSAGRWLELTFICGLAGVFLANGVTALLQPGDFTALVEGSAIGRWLDVGGWSWLGTAIAVNDLVLGTLLLVAIWARGMRMVVLAWAGAWLLAVTVVRLTALDAFPW
jgi:hypothetical protein